MTGSLGEALAEFNVPMGYPAAAFCNYQNPEGCKLLKRDHEAGIALLMERWHPGDCITERPMKAGTREWILKIPCPKCSNVEMRLCQCGNNEVIARQDRAISLDHANLPNMGDEKTFENFDSAREGAGKAFAAVSGFTRGGSIDIIVLEGGYGCGKTHLAEGAGRRLLSMGKTVRYETGASVANQYRDIYGNPENKYTEQSLTEWFHGFDLLIIDEFSATAGATDRAKDWLFELIDWRIRRHKMLIVCTNKSKVEIHNDMGGRLADRLWARNQPQISHVSMSATSYR